MIVRLERPKRLGATHGDEVVLVDGDLTNRQTELLHSIGRIAWDIETSGLDWRTERIATCQLYAPRIGGFVVRVKAERPRHLIDLLGDRRLVKVFHHAAFDLRFMAHHWGAVSHNVKCTKVAAKLVFPGEDPASYSLRPLLQRLLAVGLDKSEQRSDWFRERLSSRQLDYAVDDVRFLLPLSDELELRAQRAGLEDLLYQCYAHLPTRTELDIRGYPDVFAY